MNKEEIIYALNKMLEKVKEFIDIAIPHNKMVPIMKPIIQFESITDSISRVRELPYLSSVKFIENYYGYAPKGLEGKPLIKIDIELDLKLLFKYLIEEVENFDEETYNIYRKCFKTLPKYTKIANKELEYIIEAEELGLL